jgi:hypothetical protein
VDNNAGFGSLRLREIAFPTSSLPEISPEDWALTPRSVQRALQEILGRGVVVEEALRSLRSENERLREQTQRSARTSSQPPSRDTPANPPRRQRQSSGRTRGAHPGPAGPPRTLYPAEEWGSVRAHRPPECQEWGTAVSGNDPTPVRPQVGELSEVPPRGDDYRLHRLPCSAWGEAPRARLPAGGPAGGYGPRLAAAMGVLGGKYRQSARQTPDRWADCFHVAVALGAGNTLRQAISAALAAPVAEAPRFAQEQEVATMAETGWRQGNRDGKTPTQRQAWVGVLVTRWGTVCQVLRSRGPASASALGGEVAG